MQVPFDAPDDLNVQRVLKRIDLDLKRQLHEAVNQVIVNHMQLLMPQLCEEINEVIQRCVIRAFEDEAALGRQRDVKT